MIGFGRRTALMLLKPLIQDIIKDILTAGTINASLEAIKAEVVEQVMGIVQETHFSWDDYLAERIFEFIQDGNVLDTISLKLVNCVEEWVRNNDTDWDDEIVLPALAQFRLAVEMEEAA